MKNTPFSTDHTFHSAEDDQLFLENLNRSFCAISHLNERLTDIADDPKFGDITSSINKLEISTKQKLDLFDNVYLLIDRKPEFNSCGSLITFMEELFDHIQLNSKSSAIRDLHMRSYVDFICCIDKSSLSILDYLSKNSDSQELISILNELTLHPDLKF